jgi:hypothetical protein
MHEGVEQISDDKRLLLGGDYVDVETQTSLDAFLGSPGQYTKLLISGIMEQPPRAPDPLLEENGPVFNEREPFPWQKATWLRP